MHVDDDGVASLAERAGLQLLVHRRERIVEDRLHVALAEQIGDQHPLARSGLVEVGPAAGRAGQARVVQGPDQPLLAHDVGQGLALVPGMVAQGQAVGARLV